MYDMGVERIAKERFEGKRIVLCRDTASSYLGLSSVWGVPFKYYSEKENIIKEEYINGIEIESIGNIDYVEINGLLVTTEEETICDLLENKDDIDCILESIANYYYNKGNFSYLLNRVEKRGLKEEFNRYVEDAMHYFDD